MSAEDPDQLYKLISEGVSLIESLNIEKMRNERYDWEEDKKNFMGFILSSALYMHNCHQKGLHTFVAGTKNRQSVYFIAKKNKLQLKLKAIQLKKIHYYSRLFEELQEMTSGNLSAIPARIN